MTLQQPYLPIVIFGVVIMALLIMILVLVLRLRKTRQTLVDAQEHHAQAQLSLDQVDARFQQFQRQLNRLSTSAQTTNELETQKDWEHSPSDRTQPSQVIASPSLPKSIQESGAQINAPADNVADNPPYQKALRLLRETHQSIYITGPAGTGKSTLLRDFMSTTDKKCVVLAPTGMAAINAGGQTIHSFFGFKVGPLNKGSGRGRRDDQLYRAIETIVIDEVSMVRADLMDAIDEFLRENGREPGKPFGGVQMVFIGDLYQLPPIVSTEAEAKYFSENYLSSFFFDAHVFDGLPIQTIDLTKVYRQSDPEFVGLLNRARIGRLLNEDFDQLNGHYDPTFDPGAGDGCITLTTTRGAATQINAERLKQLPGDPMVFEANIEGNFLGTNANSTTQSKDRGNDKLPADQMLELKVGAQVVFLKNDSEKRWVNGTPGKIVGFAEAAIMVEVNRENQSFVYPVYVERWGKQRYQYQSKTKSIEQEEVGAFEQYPLTLAWAITIHKSQGQSHDKVVIDLGNGAFAAGQTYVALSRSRTFDGMRLRKKINRADIQVDPRISGYRERLLRAPLISSADQSPA